MKAPIPTNETQRLAALKDYHVLDTATEQAYDDITQIAAHICHVPITTISLVDEQRQWFKSKVGLEIGETQRELAFCAHAILQTEPLIVGDARKDRRFADNALVNGAEHIRFYAGFPLITPEGLALGTLCAIDRKPRQLSLAQRTTMQALSRQVMALLELRRISARLANMLERVKILHGLLPICAWCKRVRDDRGYWNQIESYIHAHSELDFTHGICPDCFNRAAAEAEAKGRITARPEPGT